MIAETLNFTINAEFFTNHVRERWHEGKCIHTYRLIRDNLEGIENDQIFDVLSGRKKFANEGDGVILVEDDWSPEKDGLINYPTPSLEALFDRMEEWEKYAKHFDFIKTVSPLAHAANGMPIYRGGARVDVTHASPIGLVHHEYLTYMLCKMLPQPTNEEWSSFWDKHTDAMRKDLDMRPGEDSAARALRHIKERIADVGSKIEDEEDADDLEDYQEIEDPEAEKKSDHFDLARMAQSGDVEGYLKKQEEMEKAPCPEPDPQLKASSGYVLPNGDFYGCPYMGHKYLAAKLFAKMKIETNDTEIEADNRGWVRINTNIEGFHILIQKKPTNKQKDTVLMWCALHDREVPENFR